MAATLSASEGRFAGKLAGHSGNRRKREIAKNPIAIAVGIFSAGQLRVLLNALSLPDWLSYVLGVSITALLFWLVDTTLLKSPDLSVEWYSLDKSRKVSGPGEELPAGGIESNSQAPLMYEIRLSLSLETKLLKHLSRNEDSYEALLSFGSDSAVTPRMVSQDSMAEMRGRVIAFNLSETHKGYYTGSSIIELENTLGSRMPAQRKVSLDMPEFRRGHKIQWWLTTVHSDVTALDLLGERK